MKKSITIRIDEDVLDWFRSSGTGYQSRMNDALRNHMDYEGGKEALNYVDLREHPEPPKKSDPAGAKQDVIDSLKAKVAKIPGKTSDPYFRPMEKKGGKK